MKYECLKKQVRNFILSKENLVLTSLYQWLNQLVGQDQSNGTSKEFHSPTGDILNKMNLGFLKCCQGVKLWPRLSMAWE